MVKGSVEVLEELKAKRRKGSNNGPESADDRTLLLCWPDLDSGFATACLSAYTGDAVIYVGEGMGGSTAEGSFFDALGRDWLLEVPETVSPNTPIPGAAPDARTHSLTHSLSLTKARTQKQAQQRRNHSRNHFFRCLSSVKRECTLCFINASEVGDLTGFVCTEEL